MSLLVSNLKYFISVNPHHLWNRKPINYERLPLQIHRIGNPLLPCNFQLRTELSNLDCWHLTVLPEPSLSRQTWRKYTFAADTSVPWGISMFRNQSEGQHSYCQGSQDHWEENKSKMNFSNEAARKSFSACVMWQPGLCGDPGDTEQWGKDLWGANGCCPVNVPVPVDSRLALDPTLCWEGCVIKVLHTIKCKSGPHFPWVSFISILLL